MPTKQAMERGHFRRWDVSACGGEPEPHAEQADHGQQLAETLNFEPLVGRLLARRGVEDAEQARRFLDPTLHDLHEPASLPGCTRAADRLVRAVRNGERIVIYGDYDVDGVSATAILYHTLKAADAEADVRRYVPHRIDEGYGINEGALEQLIDEGASLVISVDCGITATGPAELAQQRGVDLIVTDHHEMAEELPGAFAIVHPRLHEHEHGAGANGDDATTAAYPFGELCGAGVAYKIAWQFAQSWCGSERVSQTFRTLLVNLLSLAALGTVADVVPLVDENRIITMFGLRRIKNTPFVGLNALIDASNLRGERIDSYHVGFVLGPRLNACGRMGHAREAIELLTDPAEADAERIAAELNRANEQRRATQRRIFEQAKQMVADGGYDGDGVRALVLGHEDWHPGVVGIVASRMVEAFGRPTVLLNTAEDEAHGSARSIDGFNMHEALVACREHLTTFGGHAMAAGMRLPADSVDAFRRALAEQAAEQLSADDLTPLLRIDAEAGLPALTQRTVGQIRRLAPFGRANPEPLLLLRGLRLPQPAQTMGREARHLQFFAEQGGATIRCVGWNMGELAERLPGGAELDLVAEPKLNHFNGRTTAELILRDLRWQPGA